MAAVATSRWRKHGNVAIRNDGRMSASPGGSPSGGDCTADRSPLRKLIRNEGSMIASEVRPNKSNKLYERVEQDLSIQNVMDEHD